MKEDSNGSSSNHPTRIDQFISMISKAREAIQKVWGRLLSWGKRREEALVEGLRGLAAVLKNGGNGEWKRVTKFLAWLGEYVQKNSWIDAMILAMLIVAIVALIIITKGA